MDEWTVIISIFHFSLRTTCGTSLVNDSLVLVKVLFEVPVYRNKCQELSHDHVLVTGCQTIFWIASLLPQHLVLGKGDVRLSMNKGVNCSWFSPSGQLFSDLCCPQQLTSSLLLGYHWSESTRELRVSARAFEKRLGPHAPRWKRCSTCLH